jgi:hypothetical protein
MSRKSRVVPAEWNLPAPLRTRLEGKIARQRCLHANGHTVLLLHEPPRHDAEYRERTLFHYSAEQGWANSRNNKGIEELDALVDRYEKLLDELEATLGEATSARTCFETLRALNPITRALKNLIGSLQLAKDALPEDAALADQIEEALTQERVAELLLADARNALDFALAEETERHTQVNLELTKAAHRMNLMVALFLPVTALASIFGMNLTSGLESKWAPYLFWTVLVMGVFLGFGVRAFIDRAKVPMVERFSPRRLLPKIPLPLMSRGESGGEAEISAIADLPPSDPTRRRLERETRRAQKKSRDRA